MRLVVVAAAALLVTAGCIQLFEPATPQTPTSGGGHTVATNYSSPAATLATLAAAVAVKGLGNANAAYAGGFADPVADGVGFTTTYDPEVARIYELSSGQNAPTWNLDLEKDFYTAFVALRTESYLMVWETYEEHGNDQIDDAAGTALLHRRYKVFIQENDIFSHVIAIGIADLTFKRFNNRWAITLWEDLVDPDVGVNPTDTDLRSFSYRRLETR